mgnify:FL=1
MPLVDLMLEPNNIHERKDKLMGFEDADSMSGTLSWSVAYFDKAPLNPALKKEPGVDHSLPKELQDRPELKVRLPCFHARSVSDPSRRSRLLRSTPRRRPTFAAARLTQGTTLECSRSSSTR